MLAIAAGRSSPSRALPALPPGRRVPPADAAWTGRAAIPERPGPPTLPPVSALARGMVGARFVDLTRSLLDIAVAPPGPQHLVGGSDGNGFVKLQCPLYLALCRGGIVGARLAAEPKDRREDRRRDADRAARHRQFLPAALVEDAADDG